MNILLLTSAAPKRAGFSTSEKRVPIGLGYLISVLKKKKHRIFFSDEYLCPSNILDTSFLINNRIDVVGISSNTICYESTQYMLENLQYKREKGEWNGKIILGGPHTTIGYKEIPEYVDHILIGEGELTLPILLDGEIKDRIVHGQKVMDLDDLPLPAWEEFIHRPYDWSHTWLDAYPLYTMNTSRGCPFHCTFCSVKSFWGRSYRCMSASRIVEDIQHMQKYYGAKAIYFREDHFTLNRKRTIDFCERLLSRNIKLQWLCETRVDTLGDFHYQKLMKAAGCNVFYIGVESGSPRILEFLNKGETIDQFIKAFDIAHRVGIKTYASFVVGLPTETDDDRRMTNDLIKRIKPDYVGNNVYLGIPGSELYEFIKENNLYEYEDDRHILYPIGFLKNAKLYYGNNPYFQVYDFHPTKRSIFHNLYNRLLKRR